MSDPERLLGSGTDAEARLLAAGLDEPPPPDLLARTLEAATGAAQAAAAAHAAATAKAAVASAVPAASGGILGAIGIGALAGLITVGAYEVATRSSSPATPSAPPAAVTAIAIAAPSAPQVATAARSPAPSTTSTASAAAPAPSVAATASTLAAELSLLDDARAALRSGDRTRARALLDRYAREIPRGQLGREAAVLRAEVESIDGGVSIP